MPSLGDCPARPTHPGRPMDDSDGQVSWLAGQCLGLRRLLRIIDPNGVWRNGSPLTVAGAAGVSHPVPF